MSEEADGEILEASWAEKLELEYAKQITNHQGTATRLAELIEAVDDATSADDPDVLAALEVYDETFSVPEVHLEGLADLETTVHAQRRVGANNARWFELTGLCLQAHSGAMEVAARSVRLRNAIQAKGWAPTSG